MDKDLLENKRVYKAKKNALLTYNLGKLKNNS